jgi:alanine dehydrogenase
VRARVVVETLESAWSEAGDLIQPRDAGLIGADHVWAELHERTRIEALRAAEPDAITLFKSVGHVALDLAALEVALARLDTSA